MQKELKFKIEGVLTRKGGHIDGPMPILTFAREMSLLSGNHFNRIGRIVFDDADVLQDDSSDRGPMYEHFVLVTESDDDLVVSIWMKIDSDGLPVAMALRSDRKVRITPIYKRSPFRRKLTQAEITLILDHVFEHPELIAIKDGDAAP